MLAMVLILIAGCADQVQERVNKDIKSNQTGLYRTVDVYAPDGSLVRTYKGWIDIEDNEYYGKVKFDLDGKRHLIYNAVVIVDEVPQG